MTSVAQRAKRRPWAITISAASASVWNPSDAVPETAGEGLRQLGELGLAFLLSALIGLEREIRRKSAGLRTYTLVGLASALFLLISKYGFSDVLLADKVVLDPLRRVAAQIVSGIGFLGAGIIFVRLERGDGAHHGGDAI